MSGEQNRPLFSIGDQHAGAAINNVGGNQFNYQDRGVDPRALLARLSDGIERSRLSDDTEQAVRAELGDLDDALASIPDRPRAAARLRAIVGILTAAGVLATAASPMVAPLADIAQWLGSAGEDVLGSLR